MTARWNATFGDTFPRERPVDAAPGVPTNPEREAAMTIRCAPPALGGEGQFASRITPSCRMNYKRLTAA
jgi:hypothetical protein